MFLIGFITGAMIGGTLALIFHCLLIVGKESDVKWEEEQIMNQEEKKEKQDMKISKKSRRKIISIYEF